MGITQLELIAEFENQAGAKGWTAPLECFPTDGIPDNFYPDRGQIFRALGEFTPEEVKYVLLGQDPYTNTHTRKRDGATNVPNAIGIAFAVDEDRLEEPPESLRLLMERVYPSGNGNPDLKDWSHNKGVLLLNVGLTVPRPVGDQKPADMSSAHLPLWHDFSVHIIAQLRKRNRTARLIACGAKARKVLCDGLEEAGDFISCYHPSRPLIGGEKSFARFLERDEIGLFK